jgi:transcriptional regulator with XRE-family HTH domain
MADYSLKEFGRRIKNIRRELNLTQKELAAELGLSASFISDIESGRSKACLDFFYYLAKKFDVNLYYLILGEGETIGSKGMGPFPGNIKIGTSVESKNELLWYIERSPMLLHTLLGFTTKFIYENEKYIKKEIDEYNAREKGSKGETS